VTAEAEIAALVETVREGFRFSRDDHHSRCSSRTGGTCDCYARFHEPYHAALDSLAARLRDTTEALTRAAWVAQHLYAMIDRETWLSSGGDDGQGHYEGDYWAEQIVEEIRGWAALASPSPGAGEPE
jgi:hypothetical protein